MGPISSQSSFLWSLARRIEELIVRAGWIREVFRASLAMLRR